ncbi:MAG: hypothetical protein K0R63_1556 [Rickettsiales bacterium]|jgi:uncharacterized RDD family membrane protein YckC|nr:hypothetical protein [Rickettsiales bacterium]
MKMQNSGVRRIEYAGFWRRVGADVLDYLIIPNILVSLPIFYFRMQARGHVVPGNLDNIFELFILLSPFLYGFYLIFPLGRSGATLGMKVLKTTILATEAERVSFKRAFCRAAIDIVFFSLAIMNYWRLIPFFDANGVIETTQDIWFLGNLVVVLLNHEKKSLRDFFAGTVVVRVIQEEKLT